jgi:hypothetical protein
LLNLLSPRQLKEWMCYATLHPFGERNADGRIARLICSMYQLVAAIHGKRSKATPEDFMPPDLATILERGLNPQDQNQMMATMMALVAMTGGKHYKHGDPRRDRTKPAKKKRRKRDG